jgi:hypothetical protein
MFEQYLKQYSHGNEMYYGIKRLINYDNHYYCCEVQSSLGGDYEENYLLKCYAV